MVSIYACFDFSLQFIPSFKTSYAYSYFGLIGAVRKERFRDDDNGNIVMNMMSGERGFSSSFTSSSSSSSPSSSSESRECVGVNLGDVRIRSFFPLN